MKYNLEQAPTIHTVHSFGWDSVRIGASLQLRSFIVTPDALYADWSAQVGVPLTSEDLAPLQKLGADIILIGTGPEQCLPDMAPFRAFVDRGQSIEFMSSTAACRTYNILAIEQRKVAAGIILPLGMKS
ncbi:MAG: hypothetical protein CL397_13205 [Acidiferrobacteraceae bacterium]|nr:hypothetical protein [Acidiferrobacteraceae bacterium]|tara:strand:+ start:14772 stop:15158 length:387 start_codon:yes stop_codon:yes gene_type:complete